MARSLLVLITSLLVACSTSVGEDESATDSDLSTCAGAEASTSTSTSTPPSTTRFYARRPIGDPANAVFFAHLSKLAYVDDDSAAVNAAACRYGIVEARSFKPDDALRGEWRDLYGGNVPDAQALVLLVTPADASSPNEKVVVVAYRGTDSARDFLIDASAMKRAANEYGTGADVRVHRGFFLQAEALWNRIEAQVWDFVLTPEGRALRDAPGGLERCAKAVSPNECTSEELSRYFRPVFFTGHSLGGAVAAIVASRVMSPKSEAEVHHLTSDLRAPAPPKGRGYPIGGVATFGQPRVGNQAFVDVFKHAFVGNTHASRASLGEPYVRFGNEQDFVPMLPLRIMDYRHGGLEVWYERSDALMTRRCTRWEDTLRQAFADVRSVVTSNWGDIVTARDHGMDGYVATMEQALRDEQQGRLASNQTNCR